MTISDFYRTFARTTHDWVWEPWEYVAVNGRDIFHRADPARPDHTMCGVPHTGLIGNPHTGRPFEHCPACLAAPAPAQPSGFYRFEFARHRPLADGRYVDIVSIQHTAEPEPVVWELLPEAHDRWRKPRDLIVELGWRLLSGPHLDPRTDTTWARVVPTKPLQNALF